MGALILLRAARGGAQQSVRAVVIASPLVFDGVTVVDVEHGKLVAQQRIVIGGNRIESAGVASTVPLPKRAQVIDGRGKYLIPGLWDIHIHPARAADVFYPLLVANGVTGIRDAGSPVPLDTLRLWRREILAGTRVGPPRQILSGQSLDGGGCPLPRQHIDITTCVADSADAVQVVDSLKAAGADMIKAHALPAGLYFAIAAEARRLGIPFGGHVAAEQGEEPLAMTASDSGARIIDHFRFTNPLLTFGVPFSAGLEELTDRCLDPHATNADECRAIADTFHRHDTWVSMDGEVWPARPYPGHQEFWAGGPLPIQWLRDSILARGDTAGPMHLVERVHFPILAGTDLEPTFVLNPAGQIPGFTLQATLATYVAAGMTPLAALQSATLNPAKMWHATDSLGTVAAGKLADLVLLDADPLADFANLTAIRAVVANGRYFDRAALDQLLAGARAAAKAHADAP